MCIEAAPGLVWKRRHGDGTGMRREQHVPFHLSGCVLPNLLRRSGANPDPTHRGSLALANRCEAGPPTSSHFPPSEPCRIFALSEEN